MLKIEKTKNKQIIEIEGGVLDIMDDFNQIGKELHKKDPAVVKFLVMLFGEWDSEEEKKLVRDHLERMWEAKKEADDLCKDFENWKSADALKKLFGGFANIINELSKICEEEEEKGKKDGSEGK